MELEQAAQLTLVRAYVQDNFIAAGMCADFASHDKGDGNPHAHIILTMEKKGSVSQAADELCKVHTGNHG